MSKHWLRRVLAVLFLQLTLLIALAGGWCVSEVAFSFMGLDEMFVFVPVLLGGLATVLTYGLITFKCLETIIDGNA